MATFDWPAELLEAFDQHDYAFTPALSGKAKPAIRAGSLQRILQAELNLGGKGVAVDKDGTYRRIHFPAIGAYWWPNGNTPSAWDAELTRVKERLG